MKNAVIYARANHEPEMDKLKAQVEKCCKCAGQNGYKLVGCYVDAESSNRTIVERPGWKTLLETCRMGHVQCVVVASADRISRSQKELYDCLAQLKETGVEAIFTEGTAL